MLVFEIDQFMKEFSIKKDTMLGSGHDGNVYLVQHDKSKELYALKCSNIQDQLHLSNFYNEVSILSHIQQHPFIINLYGYSKDQSCILLDHISSSKLPIDIAKTIFFHVLNALQHVHHKGYTHGDIKPENILISNQNIPKLTDFGFSRPLDQPLVGGSQGYTAPEVYTTAPYDTTKADIFSMGVLLFVMAVGYRPFIWNRPNQQDDLWKLILLKKWDRFWQVYDQVTQVDDQVKLLIQAMMDPDFQNRPTIQQVMENDWFKSGLVDLFKIQSYFKQGK